MKLLYIILIIHISLCSFCQTNKQTAVIEDDISFIDMSNEQIVEYIINMDARKEKEGEYVQEFFAENIDGSLFSSMETKRVIFYNCWFSTCAPCIEEMPMLNKLYDRYKDQVEFVAITFMPISDILDK